jgi:hypothetical protein
MSRSVSGYVNQFPLDQFVVFGSFGRKPLKIVDREQGAGKLDIVASKLANSTTASPVSKSG